MSIFSFLKSFRSVKKIFHEEVHEQFSKIEVTHDIITEEDIKHLPPPVQKYSRYSGWIGKEKVYNAKIIWDGTIKMNPKKKFVNLNAVQYNFISHPTRIIHLKNVMIGGRDIYMNGRGNMLIKLFSLFTVADESGEHMDKSALVTFMNDVCLLMPGALIEDYFSWEPIDDLSAVISISDTGYTVSATIYFNEEGQLVNFITNDRYMDNKDQPVKWSTPVKNYTNFNDLNLPGYGEGIWHLDDGDFHYVTFNLRSIQFNMQDKR